MDVCLCCQISTLGPLWVFLPVCVCSANKFAKDHCSFQRIFAPLLKTRHVHRAPAPTTSSRWTCWVMVFIDALRPFAFAFLFCSAQHSGILVQCRSVHCSSGPFHKAEFITQCIRGKQCVNTDTHWYKQAFGGEVWKFPRGFTECFLCTSLLVHKLVRDVCEAS